MSVTKKIYYDNNATTFMPKKVVDTMIEYVNQGNPSASYESAQKSKKMMDDFRTYIADIGEFDTDDFEIIFNSGATEGNAMIIRSIVDGFSNIKRIIPHIITSSTEHKSILLLCEDLEKRKKIQLSIVKPTIEGMIMASDVEAVIQSNTALISIMAVNNEIGTINNIVEIGSIAHKHKIPYHTDAVQLFGKCPVKPLQQNVDAFTVSFHKLHGPAGVGMLVIRKALVNGYKLGAQIHGSQNSGLRGGTENVIGIAGSFTACKNTLLNRTKKNVFLQKYRIEFLNQLKDNFQLCTFENYLQKRDAIMASKTHLTLIVVISPTKPMHCVQTTLLISIVSNHVKVCNTMLKNELCTMGVIVSIGSACNTSSDKASHVLNAIGAPEEVKRGTLRISFSDLNKMEEIPIFMKKFTNVVLKHEGKK